MTIIVLLPLLHFVCAVLCLSWQRGTRGIILAALLIDAILLGALFAVLDQAGSISITLGGWGRNVGIELVADRTSLVFGFLTLFLEGSILCYLWREHLQPYFFMLLHLLLGAVFSLLFAQDLFNIYVIMELLTLVSFLLVGYGKRPHQIWASLKYLFLASLGMGIYLLGVAVIYYHTGTMNLGLIAIQLAEQQNATWVLLSSSLLVTGIAVKAGIFIFSLWLPAAHASASPAVSALLSGLVIKMGVVVLLRLATIFPLSGSLLVLGSLTGILGIVYAIAAHELKYMLAFQTLSHIGYLLIGIAAGSKIALSGILCYVLAHGLVKGLLFLAAGSASQATGKRNIRELIMERSSIPVVTRAALLVGTLGIIGLPPFAGFYGKALLNAGMQSYVTQTILALLSFGTVVSFARLIPLFWFEGGGYLSRTKSLSFLILALPIVLFFPLTHLFVPAWQWQTSLNTSILIKNLVVIGMGILLARPIANHFPRLEKRFFRLEEAAVVILSGFFLVFLLLLFT